MLQLIELVAFENIEHLQNRHAARARRRHCNHRAISIRADQRLAPHGFIVFKIFERHHTAVVFDRFDDRRGDPALVKNLSALLRDRFESFGQIRLPDQVALFGNFAIGRENAPEIGESFHAGQLAFNRNAQRRIQGEPVTREFDRPAQPASPKKAFQNACAPRSTRPLLRARQRPTRP